MAKIFKIHKDDNVAVAVSGLQKGDNVTLGDVELTALDDVPAGHKIALRDIAQGENVVKYGFPIGTARNDIAKGSWCHSHNIKSRLGDLLSYSYEPEKADRTPLKNKKEYTFMGYEREDGRAGIRNEVWIIPTVGCVNSIARLIEQESQQFKTENIDGIFAYNHPHGCSQLGDDQQHTLKFLCSLINSPNAGAVLVLSLGCENNQVDLMKQVLGPYDENRVKFLICQEHEDEVGDAVKLMAELCKFADRYRRTEQPASKLVLGLKCGGSDGFSGITANPLVGAVANKIVAAGGTAILTEVPEMFGAEPLMLNRCKDEETFNKAVNLINNFKKYFMRYGEKVDENPSPGNKKGGITTLEDKSLGCVQKGGTSIVQDVLSYGERATEKGLLLLQGPGNDLVASNVLAAAGAHVVLFTTGRGTPFSSPVPTIKISSNSHLASYKSRWIDFNAGQLLEGKTMEQVSEEFFEFILDVASGRKHAKSEVLDKHELAIFKDGVTL